MLFIRSTESGLLRNLRITSAGWTNDSIRGPIMAAPIAVPKDANALLVSVVVLA
jgi:hypothetical protein